MKKELANFILKACENSDTFFDGDGMPEIYENYSGKGMFGKKTTGIVCSNKMSLIAAVSCETIERLGYSNDTDDEAVDLHEMLEDIRHIKTDSMGNQTILY